VPVFALANAGVRLDSESIAAAFGPRVTWAALAALIVGKAVGVVGTIAAVTASGLGRLPDGITRWHILGLGLVCGLGFTVSLFVTQLSRRGFKTNQPLNKASHRVKPNILQHNAIRRLKTRSA
jgi:Na+/H+ antiporter NhaA